MADLRVALGGRSYGLRPTFGAMREIEARTGLPCSELLRLHAAAALKVEEVATIVWAGAEAAGESFTLAATAERVFERRVSDPELRDVVAEYLLALLYAPDEAKKKLDGEWRKSRSRTSSPSSGPRTRSDGDPETSGNPLPGSSGPS